ncbi:hypothetical protein A2866_05850 [Candidatus Roizmanbacteria bacterium RIFCSPHIGHO2_01_FULL_39_8]|uniref:UDP-glucose/GDP-mannose dehydrogenase dimerisation domain-containing protein n=2 Tax=Candidatus Roizmaniibacteriota TaxID=1752723 RepID=A0A1F7GTE7_9BACT|nr:MAG: hypothetical protein A2866_05850 [Candidatus Roizmanbacteria bacterium RIFCSPHIGHO2_01_FULL_39_8]OGK27228.1 MAG: hypothetical protein A3C28_04295 [Candidatus Roizmanbacteria bacterium RIFCSPHIGHO2_02_FULL_39_9]
MKTKKNGFSKEKPNGFAKKPSICIIGPGVVGQATGKVFAQLGYKTAFLGGNEEKRKKLKEEGYVTYDRNELFDGLYDFDISFFTVPTPTIDGKISLLALTSAAIDLGKRLAKAPKKYHLAVVKSTVPPGTTESLVIPLIEKYSKRKVGKDFGVCMNPEYLREKTAFEDSLRPWIILIGQYDKRSGDLLERAYEKFTCPIFRSTLREAEMQKYIHNLFNAVKISFFNEMRQVGKKIGADPEKIFAYTVLSCEGIWNPKYGTKDFGPFSGSCLPKDTKAFLEWGKNNKFDLPLLESAIKVNRELQKNGERTQKYIGLEL